VVIELTHRKGEEKYFDYIERIRSIAGITVKVSDVAVNLEHAKLNPNYAGLIPRYKKTLDTLLERIKD
jgi:hypothetical protein